MMSSENRSSTTPPPAPSVYTIYPAGFQGNVNYEFQCVRPEDSPPKYEDVISGEYLKSNYSSFNYQSTPTVVPAYQSGDHNAHCSCPRLYTTHSEHSSDDNVKAKRCSAVCSIIVLCLIALIVLRIPLLMIG